MPVLDRCDVAHSTTLLTWNVNQRTTLLEKQADHVLLTSPDVVCLQEVTPNGLTRWTTRLEAAGYEVQAGVPVADGSRVPRFGVLIASRFPLSPVVQTVGVPWPERLLIADVQLPGWPQALRVVCLHAPTRNSPDQAKIRTFEAVSASLAALPDHLPAVLCGDLNAAQHEALDGTVTTFGQGPTGKVRGGLGAREDEAERAILRGPTGWSDAFRALHDYEVCGRSWKASTGSNPGFRLDHILLSGCLTPVECAYDHDVRIQTRTRPWRLSDHSAMHATFALETP
jgi:exonuclease III